MDHGWDLTHEIILELNPKKWNETDIENLIKEIKNELT